MGLGEHLEELRRRVFLSLVVLAPVFMIIFYWGERLLGIVIKPMQRSLLASGQSPNLIATGAVETFAAVLKLSAVMTLVICAPWVVYQAWRFVAPGLYAHERRFAYILAPMSVVLSICAALFMYFVMLPVLLLFLVNYGNHVGDAVITATPPPGTIFGRLPILEGDPPGSALGDVWINQALMEVRIMMTDVEGKPAVFAVPLARSSGISIQPRIVEFVGLFLTMALGFVIAFQTPVVVLLLGWVGILRPEMMTSYRKHVVVACAFLGAILTPSPDPFSMVLMTVPLYLLYELGLLLLRLLPVSRLTRDADAAAEEQHGGPASGP